MWRQGEDGGLRCVAGPPPRWTPARPEREGIVDTPDGRAAVHRLGGVDGFWVELLGADDATLARAASAVVPAIAAVVGAEWQRARVAEELAGRYEEIDLLYAITDILGRTTRLEEAAQTIVQEVATVVGARRASIMVIDEQGRTLQTVAARGFSPGDDFTVSVDDPASVAARVFRERRILANDVPEGSPAHGDGRVYRGQSYLAVPICYGTPGGPVRCIGVINLTDRVGGDRFSAGDRKLLGAIASQVGAAIENARLAARDRQQQRLRRELELAHDLQLQLLPRPSVLHGDAEVAARCAPAESVGGDFYTFSRLARGKVGVMIGDVSSHGFGAALVMAHVLSAAGIHAAAAASPDEVLVNLLDSVGSELRETDMYFTVFYGVLDRYTRSLSYASAGHPWAFRLPRGGEPERLGATSTPLGLVEGDRVVAREVPWNPEDDLLCLWTDGLVDARSAAGERYGEARLLARLQAHRELPAEEIVRAVMADADAWAARPTDDRTLVVLRL